MRDKIIFASDFHLGIDAVNTSKERELLIVEWLTSIQDQIKELYLVGDIFDYWYEYKRSIPKGFSDFFSMLKILRNQGVKIVIFTGNHDMWMFDYFTKEYGIEVTKKPKIFELGNKRFFVAHGDGLGPGDYTYKVIKKIFSNAVCQFFFSMIHPTIALGLMRKISQRDEKKYTHEDQLDLEKEWLVLFSKQYNKEQDSNQLIDYFIFGHRHLMYDIEMEDKSQVINLGDWINYMSYAIWDGKELILKQYKNHRIS